MIFEMIHAIGMCVGFFGMLCKDDGTRWLGLGLLIFNSFAMIIILLSDIIELIS